jgi:hypothetical protein
LAVETFKAAGFASRTSLRELMAKNASTASFHWSNWGAPSEGDQNLALYAISRSGWDWGVLAGCLILTRATMRGGKATPATGLGSCMVAGRIAEVWPYMWETVSADPDKPGQLLPLVCMKVEIMPNRFAMVSVCFEANRKNEKGI